MAWSIISSVATEKMHCLLLDSAMWVSNMGIYTEPSSFNLC